MFRRPIPQADAILNQSGSGPDEVLESVYEARRGIVEPVVSDLGKLGYDLCHYRVSGCSRGHALGVLVDVFGVVNDDPKALQVSSVGK